MAPNTTGMGFVSESQNICFEQPLNERARTFLRLEHLFKQANYFRKEDSAWHTRAHILSLLDILTLLSRSDIRTEIAKELGEQVAKLEKLQNRPGVNNSRLEDILNELSELHKRMQQMQTQFNSGQLRDNEFLNAFSNRSAIPGGSCSFDLPGFHLWLNREEQFRTDHLEKWSRNLDFYEHTVSTILKLTRTSANPEPFEATEGVYVHELEKPCQLVRVFLEQPTSLFPEISAGRHRCTIRFMQQDDRSLTASQTHKTVAFDMACCHF